MSFYRTTLFIGICICVASVYESCWAQINVKFNPPIAVPGELTGFRYPHASFHTPAVVLEVFIELNCPDSDVELPVLEKVVDYYGASEIGLVVHQFPLPYHRNGLISTQGLYVIRDVLPKQSFNYMHEILNNWENFSSAVTADFVDSQILNLLTRHAATATGIDEDIFKAKINGYRTEVINSWKYGARRGVAGTPWFFLNGVDLGIVGNPTFDDWISYLNPLLAPHDNLKDSVSGQERDISQHSNAPSKIAELLENIEVKGRAP